VDTESIGNVLCKKAEDLDVAAMILSMHSKSRLQEFFLGSITNFCT
jgi:nucleotide-binding universal stress UspA family protein